MSTVWRHLADKWSRGRRGKSGGGEKEEGRGGAELGTRRNQKNYSSQRPARRDVGGEESRKEEGRTGSEAASEPGFPGCTASGGGRGRCGAFGAAANAGLGFPGSRRGSLRRAGAREPPSEAAEAAAQASGSSWSSSFIVSAPSAPGAAVPGPFDMAAVLQQVLERAELNKLPKSVQNKLEKFLADQQSEIDGLKGRHEKFKVESGKCDALPALISTAMAGLPLQARTACGFTRSLPRLQEHPRPLAAPLTVCLFLKFQSTLGSVFFVIKSVSFRDT